MSSAILYVAIVAIWVGVLIPRWLKRDPPSGEQVSDETVTTDAPAEEEQPEPPRQRDIETPRARPQARRPVTVEARRAVPAEARPVTVEARRAVPAEARRAVPAEARPKGDPARAEADRAEGDRRGAPRDREHARVLSARRRLLGLLVALTIGSVTLAGTGLAAWWVIVPPSVMMLGYLAVLRAAAKADAERRERARTRAAAVTRKPAAPAAPAAPPAPALPVPAPPLPAPEAEIIDIGAAQPDEDFYDQYADAKLRAVGDLTRG